MQSTHVVIPLAGGLKQGGECLDEDTERRLEGMAKMHATLSETELVVILLSAGRAEKDGKISRYPRQRVSMARMMRDRLKERHGIQGGVYILALTWGTRFEIEASRRFAEKVLDEELFYHVVTAWWHAPRAWLVARHALPRGKWKVHCTKSAWRLSALSELWKLSAELLRFHSPRFATGLEAWRGRP